MKPMKAKNLPAGGQQQGGGVCLPTCFQAGIAEMPQMNTGPQRLPVGEERLPGLWLPKPLLNSPSHPAQGLVSGGGEQMSAGQTEV